MLRSRYRRLRVSRAHAEERIKAKLARMAVLQRELEEAERRYAQLIAELDRRTEAACRAAGIELPLNGQSPTEPLREARFEELRELGLSLTQADRVLRYQREGALDSPAALDEVPGIPAEQLNELKRLLRA